MSINPTKKVEVLQQFLSPLCRSFIRSKSYEESLWKIFAEYAPIQTFRFLHTAKAHLSDKFIKECEPIVLKNLQLGNATSIYKTSLLEAILGGPKVPYAWAGELLVVASRIGDRETVREILVERHVIDEHRKRAVIAASENGHANVVKTIIEDTSNNANYYRTLAVVTCGQHKHWPALETLLNLQYDTDAIGKLVIIFSQKGDLESVEKILTFGEPLDEQLRIAIHHAKTSGHEEIEKLLLSIEAIRAQRVDNLDINWDEIEEI